MAEMKLHTLRLADHLHLDIGAYGDTAECRADLVHIARSKAAIATATTLQAAKRCSRVTHR